jgi:hypothetical protein
MVGKIRRSVIEIGLIVSGKKQGRVVVQDDDGRHYTLEPLSADEIIDLKEEGVIPPDF